MPNLEDWIGKTQSKTETIDIRHANMLAATLGAQRLQPGDVLPECWHWAWFNDALAPEELGRDGHPRLGGFMPPVPLPRRMWAGGTIEFLSPLRIGREITKTSTIRSIDKKQGKTGELYIVSVEHCLQDGGTECVRDVQNLVYREDPKENAAVVEPPKAPTEADHSNVLKPNSVLMFRYSALTFNGHRIHYDADYARKIEGYPNTVFHAPLTATALCALAKKNAQGRAIEKFSYKATSPLFCDDEINLCLRYHEGGIRAWAANQHGDLAMSADVILAG